MTPCILIVEDQASMRAQLRDFVQLLYPDALVAESGDGFAALVFCATHRPDVMLMDISLPDLDGLRLAAHIRVQFPEIRVIVVSHHAAGIYRERSKAAGVFGYVSKDKVATELLPLIMRALERDEEGSGDGA